MSKYHIDVSGAFSLHDIENTLNGEELLEGEFLGSRLWANSEHKLTNLVEFEEFDDFPEPPLKALTVLEQALANRTPIWTGVMVIEGVAKNTFIYRIE